MDEKNLKVVGFSDICVLVGLIDFHQTQDSMTVKYSNMPLSHESVCKLTVIFLDRKINWS